MTCNNDTEGEWDYNAWNLKIDEITSDSKCTLAFNGNLSKEDYQNYIEAGISTRRNTYRGKDLTDFFNNNQDAFYKQIKEGTFDDIYVGDYIKTTTAGKNITWLVADIDNYLHSGSVELDKHHLTIIPAAPLMSAQMNDSDKAAGGYTGSKMYTETLDTVYSTYINPVFGSNIIKYSNLLTDQVDETKINRFGVTSGIYTGASNSYKWVDDRKLDLMSEMNVYGSIVWSSSGFDTGLDNRQYALFRLKPEFISSDGNITFYYWLKDVTSSVSFAGVLKGGGCASINAATSINVRPRFLIG